MDKIRGLINMLLGLLGLVALAVGLSWLFGPQGPRPRQQVFPSGSPLSLRTCLPLLQPLALGPRQRRSPSPARRRIQAVPSYI
jgi:hypothetical protein